MKRTQVILTIVFLFGCSSNQTSQSDQTPVKAEDAIAEKREQPTPAERAKHQGESSMIFCNQFEPKVVKVDKNTIGISLITDLPDFTELIVSVSRGYKERGNDADYSQDYFSKKTTVGEMRVTQNVDISDTQWKKFLAAKQQKMAKFGLGFAVGKVDSEIEVAMVVPINQSNSRFGEKNSKLHGDMVSREGLRVIRGNVRFSAKMKGCNPETDDSAFAESTGLHPES